MIKQVVAAIQGPKSKKRVLIVFKIVEGFKTYVAYINSIKHYKKEQKGGINYQIIKALKNHNCKLKELFIVSQRGGL